MKNILKLFVLAIAIIAFFVYFFVKNDQQIVKQEDQLEKTKTLPLLTSSEVPNKLPKANLRPQVGVSGINNNEIAVINNSSNNGFLFINSKYVDSPYEFSLHEGWLMVNGLRMRKLCNWPINVKVVSKNRPVIPEKILKNAKSFDDLRFHDVNGNIDSWTFCTVRWIENNFENYDTQCEEIKKFYESLPFVSEVTIDDPSFRIKLKNGTTKNHALPTTRKSDFSTKEDILNEIERKKDYYSTSLNNGTASFIFNSGFELIFTRSRSAEVLPLLIEVLQSNKTETEKMNILMQSGILPPHSNIKTFLPLLSNFSGSDQLNVRVAELVKSTGAKPLTIDDINQSKNTK